MKRKTFFLTLTFFSLLTFITPLPGTAQTPKNIKIIKRAPGRHGILCQYRGKLIMFLQGTPRQMGRAHGELLPLKIKKMSDKIFFVGGGYSISKDDWFFDRMDEVIEKSGKFTPSRFITEIKAMGKAAEIPESEAMYMNFFPEMFHCSGFAVRGKASRGGRVLHGRVLDYMRDIGLQDNAIVMVFIPDGKYNWLSVSYAGFAGTVTAMNEKGLAVGQMGGGGFGRWSGIPMAFLLRKIMEEAGDVNQAVKIVNSIPGTCEHYYVFSDKKRNIVSLIPKGEKMRVLMPGEQHPLLPEVPQDTVLVSGKKRAEELSARLKKMYGKIGVPEMIEIIKRPVAMNSNLHNAIFSPETLEVWFSDAGKHSLACDNKYVMVNLKQLLDFYSREADSEKQD